MFYFCAGAGGLHLNNWINLLICDIKNNRYSTIVVCVDMLCSITLDINNIFLQSTGSVCSFIKQNETQEWRSVVADLMAYRSKF